MSDKTRTRNPVLAKCGVTQYSRSEMYKRSGRWAIKNKKATEKAAAPEEKPRTKQFQGGERTVGQRTPRYYPEEDIPKPLHSTKGNRNAPKLRSSITPGTVLILVAGKYRGRRVIFLKQLDSGLLLVTGPYKVNGVPIRRVNQRYVIATSTKVDLADFAVDAKFDDAYFQKPKGTKKAKSEEEFFDDGEGKKAEKLKLSDDRKADQKAVDEKLVPIVKKTPQLTGYLSHMFTLRNGQYPHQMKF